ncbi:MULTISPECIES: NAD-dependent epimerase/dehydratase family protein [Enterococcus]|uniref:NAD-dependent epimerase/dehydratase family protein n=1 Tax=Enterococcus TaxID=1350 RepID=UPI000EEBFA7A|nr:MULTISPECIES: NAD-dependent epimerase/dehydratase family protein [Enterococcus]HCM85011.1 epimerase [Enterococcus sp.]
MKKKALLLGGTGAMGIYVVPELFKKEYEIFVTTRKKRKSDNSGLHYLLGNAHDKIFLEQLLQRKWDVIIDFMVYTTEEFKLRASDLLEGTYHYIFVSSYRVFANSETPIVEKSPKLLDVVKDKDYLETDEYGLSKARQESILVNSSYKNWTIIRPSITYSKERFQLATLEADSIIFRAQLGIPVPVSEKILTKRTTMTWAGDVAKMIVGLVNRAEVFQEDYNVVTSESVIWKDVAQIYTEFTNLKICKINHSNYIKIVGNYYQIEYDRMFNRIMDNSKILKINGMRQTDLTPLRKGLSEEVKNITDKEKVFQDINYVTHAKMDRITHSRIPLKGASLKNRCKYLLSYLEIKKQ